MRNTTKRFRFRPLTPIHIGSGERLAVEEYIIDEKRKELVRLNVPELLRKLSPTDRRNFESAIDQGRLRDAQQLLHKPWNSATDAQRRSLERYRTRVGEGSYEQLRQILQHEQRSGEVMILPRNELSGEVIIPGSSIKGALRTAVVSYLANLPNSPRPELKGCQKGSEVEQRVLGYSQRDLEKDPFRHVSVSDSVWPASEVQIDRPRLRKLGREDEQTSGVQMHAERLLSAADGASPSTVIEISLHEPNGRRAPGVRLTWDEVLDACRSFYEERSRTERNHFKPLIKKFDNMWCEQFEPELQKGAILIRVGRFCHFDSLSIDNLRRKPGKTSQLQQHDIGSTRTMCEISQDIQVPFGWALLEPSA